jgi:PKD repeat protein
VAPGGGTFHWFFPGGTPEQSTEENPTVIYSQDGEYDVTFQITIDGVTYTKIKSNYVGMTDALNEPIFEDFEQGGFGEHWQAHHSTGGNGSWQVSSDASGYGIGTYAMKFDNWYYDAGGNRDEIWLPKWSTGNMANSAITFDVAYARYNATWSDTLAVLVSVDCGSTWQEVYKKGGTDLSTAPDQNSSPFEPNDNQWRYEAISFDPYFDGPAEQVIVAFQNRGYYGQWLYVDNINLNTAMSVNEPNVHSVNMQVFPNPTNTLLHVSLDGPSQEGAIKLYDGQGRLVSSVLVDASHRLVKTFDVNEYAAGIYLVVFETAQGQTVQRVQIK